MKGGNSLIGSGQETRSDILSLPLKRSGTPLGVGRRWHAEGVTDEESLPTGEDTIRNNGAKDSCRNDDRIPPPTSLRNPEKV